MAQQPNPWKNTAISISLLTGSALFVLLAAEVAFRVKAVFFPVHLSDYLVLDDRLGWRPRPHVNETYTMLDSSGTAHSIVYQTDDRGSRHWGAIPEGDLRIMVVGDSFTMARDASQGRTYYDRLATELNATVAAIGADGYGTLQGWMLLEEHAVAFRPDLVVWQWCENDFIGNVPQLGAASAKNRFGVLQPYLSLEGDIYYTNPDWGPWARSVSWLPSHALQGIAYRLDLLRYGKPTLANTIEKRIEASASAVPLFQVSVEITGRILESARAGLGDTPIIALPVNTRAPYYEAFEGLCVEHGIHFAAEVPTAMLEAYRRDVPVFAEDGAHWSGAGHQVAGQALADFIRSEGLLASPD